MVAWQDIIRFIRCISRISINERESQYILHFSRKEVPWKNIAMIMEMEGVSGLLYIHLKNLGLLGKLPTAFELSLEKVYQRTKDQTLTFVAEAKALSAKFKQAGIHVMALQGLSLVSIYNDPGLRPLGDADLMVKALHKKRFMSLLQELGYHNPTNTHPNIFFKDGICVDMHTHVLNLERIHSRRYLFPADVTAMWKRATPLFDESSALLMPDLYDNHIALAAHALKHGYSRLIWLVDLHESLLKLCNNIDCYEKIIERARFWRQERIVLYALILVEGLFGMRIPSWLKQELGFKNLSIIERYLLIKRIRGFVQRESFNLLWLCNIKGLANKVEFIKETAFPRDKISARISDDSSPRIRRLFYAKRLGEVIIKVGKILTRH